MGAEVGGVAGRAGPTVSSILRVLGGIRKWARARPWAGLPDSPKARQDAHTPLCGEYKVVQLSHGCPQTILPRAGNAASWAPGCPAPPPHLGSGGEWRCPHPTGSGGRVPRCITRRECMCSTALHSCAKYFHTVLSGMSRFCFLKYCSGEDGQAWGTSHKGGGHGAVPLSCPQW